MPSVDTAGAAEEISKIKDNSRTAISELAAKIYNLNMSSIEMLLITYKIFICEKNFEER